MQFQSMSPMVNKAVKGATVGAGIGFVMWLAKQLLPASSGGTHAQIEELNEHANVVLAHDRDVQSLCLQLKRYAAFDHDTYCNLLLSAAHLIHIQVSLARGEVKPSFAVPKQAAQHCSIIVESLRRLRCILSLRVNNNAAIMAEFDEIAADFQRKLNEYQFNITMAVQAALT